MNMPLTPQQQQQYMQQMMLLQQQQQNAQMNVMPSMMGMPQMPQAQPVQNIPMLGHDPQASHATNNVVGAWLNKFTGENDPATIETQVPEPVVNTINDKFIAGMMKSEEAKMHEQPTVETEVIVDPVDSKFNDYVMLLEVHKVDREKHSNVFIKQTANRLADLIQSSEEAIDSAPEPTPVTIGQDLFRYKIGDIWEHQDVIRDFKDPESTPTTANAEEITQVKITYTSACDEDELELLVASASKSFYSLSRVVNAFTRLESTPECITLLINDLTRRLTKLSLEYFQNLYDTKATFTNIFTDYDDIVEYLRDSQPEETYKAFVGYLDSLVDNGRMDSTDKGFYLNENVLWYNQASYNLFGRDNDNEDVITSALSSLFADDELEVCNIFTSDYKRFIAWLGLDGLYHIKQVKL